MALIALALGVIEHLRHRPPAPLVLPAVEAAAHRDDVAIAEFAEGFRRESRAGTAGAVDDDRTLLVGDAPFDLQFEHAAGQVDGPVERAGGVLVRFPHVEEDGVVSALGDIGGRRLADLRFHVAEQVTEVGHIRTPRSRVRPKRERSPIETLPIQSTFPGPGPSGGIVDHVDGFVVPRKLRRIEP